LVSWVFGIFRQVVANEELDVEVTTASETACAFSFGSSPRVFVARDAFCVLLGTNIMKIIGFSVTYLSPSFVYSTLLIDKVFQKGKIFEELQTQKKKGRDRKVRSRGIN
jgi:hypothetical protein